MFSVKFNAYFAEYEKKVNEARARTLLGQESSFPDFVPPKRPVFKYWKTIPSKEKVKRVLVSAIRLTVVNKLHINMRNSTGF